LPHSSESELGGASEACRTLFSLILVPGGNVSALSGWPWVRCLCSRGRTLESG
jgi:hypothetical protein